MAKAYKVKSELADTNWMAGNELLDFTDTVMCEADPDYEAWHIDQSIEDLEEVGYTVITKSISDASLEKKHAQHISKLIRF